MPAGLQVWDASGLLVVDTSMMLPRSVYIGEVSSAGSASIIPIARGESIGVPMITPVGGEATPEVTLNGSTLSWKASGQRGFRAELTVCLL